MQEIAKSSCKILHDKTLVSTRNECQGLKITEILVEEEETV